MAKSNVGVTCRWGAHDLYLELCPPDNSRTCYATVTLMHYCFVAGGGRVSGDKIVPFEASEMGDLDGLLWAVGIPIDDGEHRRDLVLTLQQATIVAYDRSGPHDHYTVRRSCHDSL